MCRNAFIALVLAALSLFSANGSPVHPAKAHKSASATATSHKKTQHQPTLPARHPAAHKNNRVSVHSSASRQTARKTARKASPKPSVHSHKANPRIAPNPEPLPPLQPAPVQEAIDTTTSFAQPGANTRPVHSKKLFAPPPLRGSHASLERQNSKTESDGLERIEDNDDLADRIARKMLVPVPVSARLTVNQSLPQDRRYCRPWTASFLSDLASAHAAAFHRPLEVTSAVRTVDYQKRLMETNGNAAAAEGEVVSPHVTGATIDIAKQGLGQQQISWLRRWLLPLQTAGKIDVEEEFQQTCFHITVYKTYAPPQPAANARQPKQSPSHPATALALASRGR